jgi:mannitol-specific phosphotransferase system IIBC component
MVAHKYNLEVKEGQLLVLACSQQVGYNEPRLKGAPGPGSGALFCHSVFGNQVDKESSGKHEDPT